MANSTTKTTPDSPLNWRKHLRIHPAAELFPPMFEAELKELAEDIKNHGLQTPIVIWEPIPDNKKYTALLDGRNRLDALALLGLLGVDEDGDLCLTKWWREREHDWVANDRFGEPPLATQECQFGDPYALALSFNVQRRHLTAEQKRELIAKLIKANPEKSNRQIADQVKASHPHIAKVRAELEKTGDVETVSTSIDTKGRKQPAKRKPAAGKPKTVKFDTDLAAKVAAESIRARIADEVKAGLATDMVCTRGDDGVDVWSAPQREVSIEQRKAEMAALAGTIDPRTAEDAKYEAAGKEVASGRALADFKFSCRTWLPKMTAEHRQEAIAYCAGFAKPDASPSETPTMAAVL
jgi:hypothetical protein